MVRCTMGVRSFRAQLKRGMGAANAFAVAGTLGRVTLRESNETSTHLSGKRLQAMLLDHLQKLGGHAARLLLAGLPTFEPSTHWY